MLFAYQSKRPLTLSITHMLRTKQVADVDVRESGESSPDDGVASRSIARTVQVAAQASQLRQARVQRWSAARLWVNRFGIQPIQEFDLQWSERHRGLQIACESVQH